MKADRVGQTSFSIMKHDSKSYSMKGKPPKNGTAYKETTVFDQTFWFDVNHAVNADQTAPEDRSRNIQAAWDDRFNKIHF